MEAAATTLDGGRFGIVRAICFGYVAFLITLITFVVATVALIFDPRHGRVSYVVVRLWSRCFLGMSGCSVRVEGLDKLDASEPRLLIANHASWFDPPAIWLAFPRQVRFVLKHELVKVPFVGWYAKMAGHFLLDRSNPRKGMALLKKAIARVHRDKVSPVVFPEGTRSVDGKLGPIRPGAFQLALQAGIDIQPVGIFGTHEIMPKGFAYPRRCGAILVRFGDPISTAGPKGSARRKELAREARDALVALGVAAST